MSLPLWCAVLLAFAKNPLRQMYLQQQYHAYKHFGRAHVQELLISVFVAPFDEHEHNISKEYHARNCNRDFFCDKIVETYTLHQSKEDEHSPTQWQKQLHDATKFALSFFSGIPDCPTKSVPFLTFAHRVSAAVGNTIGNKHKYAVKQITRSIVSRFEPPSADITVRELRRIYPDMKNHLSQFQKAYGTPKMTVQNLTDIATSPHKVKLSGWKLCCWFCQLGSIHADLLTPAKLQALRDETARHARLYAGIPLSPSKFHEFLMQQHD